MFCIAWPEAPFIKLSIAEKIINLFLILVSHIDNSQLFVFITFPVPREELYLRIQKLLNLFSDINERSEIINFGDFTYNVNNLQLKRKNSIVYLTEGENKLLIKLINKKNEIVLREELAEQDYDESELRKVDVQVTRLRQKIEINPKQPHFLKTVRGKGYKLICNEL